MKNGTPGQSTRVTPNADIAYVDQSIKSASTWTTNCDSHYARASLAISLKMQVWAVTFGDNASADLEDVRPQSTGERNPQADPAPLALPAGPQPPRA